jgi:hypothetical protein
MHSEIHGIESWIVRNSDSECGMRTITAVVNRSIQPIEHYPNRSLIRINKIDN